MKNSLLFVFILSILFYSNNANAQNMTTTDGFLLEKYMGTWYEIARFPHKFEKNLQGVTATYSLESGNRIRVLNQGYKGGLDGELSKIVGKAKPARSGEAGHLRVSFFLFFYADYKVLELGENYEWALVTSGPDYLWILSRTPAMDNNLYLSIVQMAKDKGFDTNRLEIVQQRDIEK